MNDFEYVRKSDETPAAPAPAPQGYEHVRAAEETEEEKKETKAGEVSALARKRIEADFAALKAAGYDVHSPTFQTLYTEGTRCVPTGDERLKQFRQQFDALPRGVEAAETLLARIEKENRGVIEGVPATFVFARPDAGVILRTVGGPPVTVYPTKTGWKHLARVATETDPLVEGAAQYLSSAPPRIRAAALNGHVQELAKDPERSSKMLNVAVKRFDGKKPPLAYRFASQQYTPFEVDAGLRALLSAGVLPADCRCEVFYDGERARLLFLFHQDEQVNDLACGDVFKVGVIVYLDDALRGSVVVQGAAWRNLCLNLYFIGKTTRTELRQRHVGLDASFAGTFAAAVGRVMNDFAVFREQWNAARKERLLEAGASNEDHVERLFAGLLGSGLLELPGRDPEQKLQRLMVSWRKEPGYSRADLVNAITRAAHEEAWWSNPWDAEEAQEKMTNLLYVRRLPERIEAGVTAFQDKYPNIELAA